MHLLAAPHSGASPALRSKVLELDPLPDLLAPAGAAGAGASFGSAVGDLSAQKRDGELEGSVVCDACLSWDVFRTVTTHSFEDPETKEVRIVAALVRTSRWCAVNPGFAALHAVYTVHIIYAQRAM